MSDDFKGFESANTTPVPDILFDELLTILTGAELKVLLYIIRRTRGFKKSTDAISLSQLQNGIITRDGKVLDKGCGIKRRDTIVDALASLEKKNCITVQKGTDPHGDRSTTIYGIKFKEVVTKPDYLHIMGSHQTGLPLVTKPDYGSHENRLPVVTKPDLQETVLQETVLQETDRQEERVASPHVDAPRALSETENENDSYRHDHTRKEDAWNCHNWCVAHHGTCEDYQAAIDAGWHETPTAPKIEAIPKPEAIGATDGHHTPDHPPADHRAADSVRTDGTGEPTTETPLEQTTPARVAQSAPPVAYEGHERNDGAATDVDGGPRASGGKRKGKKVTQAPPELSPEVTRFLDDWDSLHKAPLPRTERMIALAQAGIAAKIAPDEMKGCRNWLPTTDRPGRPYYRRKGVGLWDVIDKIGEYRSLADMPPETPAPLADKARKNVRDAQYEAALEKTGQPLEQEEVPAWLDFDNYVGNGPEARQRLVERGLELKAQGFCPDL